MTTLSEFIQILQGHLDAYGDVKVLSNEDISDPTPHPIPILICRQIGDRVVTPAEHIFSVDAHKHRMQYIDSVDTAWDEMLPVSKAYWGSKDALKEQLMKSITRDDENVEKWDTSPVVLLIGQ